MERVFLDLTIPFDLLPRIGLSDKNFVTVGFLRITGLRAHFVEGPDQFRIPSISLVKTPLFIPVGQLDVVKTENHFKIQIGRPTILPFGWFKVVREYVSGGTVRRSTEPPAASGLSLYSDNTLFASNIHILHYYNKGQQFDPSILHPLREEAEGKWEDYKRWVEKMISLTNLADIARIYKEEGPFSREQLKRILDRYEFMELKGIDVVVLTDEVGETDELETRVYDLRGYKIVNYLYFD